MRILFVIDHFGVGGAQRQIRNLGLQLRRFGHDIEYFCYYPMNDLRGDIDASGIAVWQMNKSRRFSPKIPLALRRRLQAGRYDVAVSYLNTPNFYLEIAALGMRMPKIVVSHRALYPAEKLPYVDRIREQFHRFADHVVVNSTPQMRRMAAEFPWLAKFITTIENGVDDAFFLIERPVASQDGLRLLAMSTVVPLKNAAGLADALALCRQRGRNDITVNWAGRQPDSDYFQVVQRRIIELQLQNQWQWLGPQPDVTRLLSQHDALVHPSCSEGMPNAVCEALAAAMPVLGSDVGGHGVMIREANAGYVFDPARPESTASAIWRLASAPPEERLRLGANGRRFARERLSMQECARHYEKLFLQLLTVESP